MGQLSGSYSAEVLQRTQALFDINHEDHFLLKPSKFVTGTTAKTLVVAISFFETISALLITAFASPLYLLAPESFSQLSGHTSHSFHTTISAIRDIGSPYAKTKESEEKDGSLSSSAKLQYPENKAETSDPEPTTIYQRVIQSAKKYSFMAVDAIRNNPEKSAKVALSTLFWVGVIYAGYKGYSYLTDEGIAQTVEIAGNAASIDAPATAKPAGVFSEALIDRIYSAQSETPTFAADQASNLDSTPISSPLGAQTPIATNSSTLLDTTITNLTEILSENGTNSSRIDLGPTDSMTAETSSGLWSPLYIVGGVALTAIASGLFYINCFSSQSGVSSNPGSPAGAGGASPIGNSGLTTGEEQAIANQFGITSYDNLVKRYNVSRKKIANIMSNYGKV